MSLATAVRGPAPAALLEVDRLTVSVAADPRIRLVDDVSFALPPGCALGLVGESGCGKSLTCLALLGLLPRGLKAEAGRIGFDGADLALEAAALRASRGRRIGMIFQDPTASLNPVRRVGRFLSDLLARHRGLTASEARAEAVALLAAVGIPEPERRYRSFPHQLSGGQNQRVMIAGALAGSPDLLIADEPTTALDVTTQAQILSLIVGLRRSRGMALLIVSHDLGVIAGTTGRVAVMYAGRIVEEAPVDALFAGPRHPYTAGLIASVPPLVGRPPLTPIPGAVPAPGRLGPGCAFADRCRRSQDRCRQVAPPLTRVAPGDRSVACHRPFAAA